MATLQDYLGITALRDAWPKWKANVVAVNNQVINHVAGSADKHSAQDITYTGDFVGKTEVKAALDQAKTEIDTIVVNASIDPEVAFARDSAVKSKTFDTLDARLEESEQDLVSYKAEIAVYLKSYEYLVVDGDWTEAIKQASQDNVRLIFPNEVLNIKTHLAITGKKNLKWVATEDVTLYDTGKVLTLSGGELSSGANGILFDNCDITFEGVFKHNNVGGGGEISEVDKDKVVPYLDFYNCSFVDFNVVIQGTENPFGTGTNDEPTTSGASDAMRSYYTRFWGCNTVILNQQKIEKARSEIYGFNEVKNLNFKGIRYYQGVDIGTFWSLAKIINCDNVYVDDINVQSESTGSFIDVSAKNAHFKNMVIDYPYGKLLDVTNEWGYNNVESGTITLKDCICNSLRGVTISRDAGNVLPKKIENLNIDNVQINNTTAKEQFSEGSVVQNLSIKNQNISNFAYVNYMAVTTETDILTNQKVDMDNIEVTCDKLLANEHVTIETRGITTVRNSYINLNRINKLSLRERKVDGVTDLSSTTNKIVFEKVKFKDTHIEVLANIDFNDCEFDNCSFISSELSGYTNPNINFNESCKFYFNNIDDVRVPGSFMAFTTSGTINKIKLSGVLTGKTYLGGLFSSFNTKCNEVVYDNFDLDVERWETDKSAKREVDGLTINSDIVNGESTTKWTIKNSHVRGRIMRLVSATNTTNNQTIQFIDTTLYSLNSVGGLTRALTTDGSSTNFGNIEIILVNNRFPSDDPAFINSNPNFRSKTIVANVENVGIS